MNNTSVSEPPLVSIGMPVFNGEKYLEEALNSLLNQSYANFELLISDNSSNDNTQKICQAYTDRDPRIRYVRQSSNIGALANFQYTLDHSMGKYFMWAACDDYWSNNWIEVLLAELKASAGYAVFGHVCQVDARSQSMVHIVNGRILDYSQAKIFRRIKFFLDFEGCGKANLFYSLFERNCVQHLPVKSYRYDYHMLFDFLKLGTIEHIPGAVLYKRIHQDAASTLEINRHQGVTRKVLKRIFLPVDGEILLGYFKSAPLWEKVFLVLAMPAKYVIAYINLFRRVKTGKGIFAKSPAG